MSFILGDGLHDVTITGVFKRLLVITAHHSDFLAIVSSSLMQYDGVKVMYGGYGCYYLLPERAFLKSS